LPLLPWSHILDLFFILKHFLSLFPSFKLAHLRPLHSLILQFIIAFCPPSFLTIHC
jgi:hypothetical protein